RADERAQIARVADRIECEKQAVARLPQCSDVIARNADARYDSLRMFGRADPTQIALAKRADRHAAIFEWNQLRLIDPVRSHRDWGDGRSRSVGGGECSPAFEQKPPDGRAALLPPQSAIMIDIAAGQSHERES